MNELSLQIGKLKNSLVSNSDLERQLKELVRSSSSVSEIEYK